ncbi:hypothetical protein Tco_0490687 [Tanacetum coccineum]
MRSEEELVLTEKKVAISTSNQRIDPEEYFTEPLFNLTQAILKQHFIYNALILTANAPEIYMQARQPLVEILWGLVNNANVGYAELIGEEFNITQDEVLSKLNLVSKGEPKGEPKYGMKIPDAMLNNIVEDPDQAVELAISVNVENQRKTREDLMAKERHASLINVAKVIKDSVKANMVNEVKNQLPKMVPDTISDFIQPRLDHTMLQALKTNQINLFTTPTTSSNNLTEYEMKEKLYNMMFKSRFYYSYDCHLGLYNALMDSMAIDEMQARGKPTHPILKKRSHNDQDPSKIVRGRIRREGKKDSINDEAPEQNWFNDFVDAVKDPEENEILEGSAIMFAKNLKEILNKEKLTKADLKGAGFELLKSRFSNRIEIEYKLSRFILLYLECLMDRNKEKKYAISLSMYYAAKYEEDGIEEIIPNLGPMALKRSIRVKSDHAVYLKHKIICVKEIEVERKHGHGLLNSIVAKRSDEKDYKFMESDYPRLSLNDIEDMYLLKKCCDKEESRICSVGVENYQRKLNLEKPMFVMDDIQHKLPYTTNGDPKDVVYLNKKGQKMLMRYDKVHKFNDGALNKDKLAMNITTEQGKTLKDAQGDVFRGLGARTCYWNDEFTNGSKKDFVIADKEAECCSTYLIEGDETFNGVGLDKQWYVSFTSSNTELVTSFRRLH